MLKLIAFVVPLGLDTFAIAAALGTQQLDARARLRASLLMTAFESVMPLVGLALGAGLGAAVGSAADDVAAVCLAAVGARMLFEDDGGSAERLTRTGGAALLLLGLSISVDELAIGFSAGLLDPPIVATVIVIAIQAFVFAQIGLRLGARVGERLRENAERAAGVVLIALAVVTLVAAL